MLPQQHLQPFNSSLKSLSNRLNPAKANRKPHQNAIPINPLPRRPSRSHPSAQARRVWQILLRDPRAGGLKIRPGRGEVLQHARHCPDGRRLFLHRCQRPGYLRVRAERAQHLR